MASIQDNRGYNQGFKPSQALAVRTQRRCDYMLSQMTLTPSSHILEIGCGTGELSYLLAQNSKAQVMGVDLCQPFIEQARISYPLANLQYAVSDFNQPEELRHLIQDQKFDYVVGNGILHHLYFNLENSLQIMRRLLKKGGKIIFLEPNLYNPYVLLIFNIPVLRKLTHLEPAEMAFSKRFITQRLRQSGYGRIQVQYKDFLLPNIPDQLIDTVVQVGNFIEKIPLLNKVAQSLFITAEAD